MTIGKNIRTLRKVRGLTQAELGEKVGASQKVIADYEAGGSRPPVERIPTLARVLGVSADELLGGKELPTAPEGKRRPKSRRALKVQRLFNSLKDEEQRVILKQIKSLSKKGLRKGLEARPR